MFLEQQISILELFLTLKTKIMMQKIQLCITETNNILKYHFLLLVSVFFYQINATLVSKNKTFSKIFQIPNKTIWLSSFNAMIIVHAEEPYCVS